MVSQTPPAYVQRIDLSHQRMAPFTIVSATQLADVVQFDPLYAKIGNSEGLSARDRAEVADHLRSPIDTAVTYAPLPSSIYAMGSYNHITHKARVWHNVTAENDAQGHREMGWLVALRDGREVVIPRACGNLSLVSAPKPHAIIVARQHAPHAVSYAGYFPPVVAQLSARIPVAAVNITGPAVPPYVPPVTTSNSNLFALPFAALVPAIIDAVHNGGGTSTPVIPPCSAGSNEIGVCHR